MDGPRRRAVGALTASLLGFGSLLAQDSGIPPTGAGVPKVMPPRSGAPVTVTVSPYGNSPLPPTGVPVGTPIPVGIPPGTPIKTIPPANGTPSAVETSFPTASTTTPTSVAPIQSPYFGYYPTQWRTFPEQAFPVCATPGQALPTYPPNMASSDTPPPVMKVRPPQNVPNPLPLNVQLPTSSNVIATGGVPAESASRPLLPFEEARGFAITTETKATEITLAKMGKPRLRSSPDPLTPILAPATQPKDLPPLIPAEEGPILPPLPTKDSIVPASAIEVPFVPAPAIPTPVDSTFGIGQQPLPKEPLKVRPPVERTRPKFSEDSTIRPAAPVIRAGGTGG